ncbi:MAG TPA: ABC transporter substrate-binding protein [Gaiella sp.]|jgi:ABC-type branched-subunit amino acid transport system substrate-binding protein|nr:ABC transporter substrate-binding protein [Gaiella sp.]
MSRFSKLAAALTLVAVLAAAVAATTASGRGQAGFTLRIGVVVPFTGASAVFGPAYAKSAGLAVQQANRALRQAGVRDVKLQIEYADDATTPEGGVNAARKLISKGADCILGALTSGSSIAIAQAATVPARVPQIGPNNSSPALTDLADNGYYFRTMPSDTLQAPILARLIKEEMGAGKTISLAGRNDAFGTGLLPPLKRALERSGMKVRGPLLYDPTAASYNSEADDIVEGNPDAYVVLDFPANYAKIGSALLRTGRFNGRKLFVAGGWPATIPSFIPAASLEGARGTVAGSLSGTKAAEAFDKLFTTSPGTKDRQTLELNNFDGALICVLAALAADSSRGSEIVKQIQRVSSVPGRTYTYLNLAAAIRAVRAGKDINYEGVGGPVDFDAKGDLTAALYNVYSYKDGKQSVVRTLRIRK